MLRSAKSGRALRWRCPSCEGGLLDEDFGLYSRGVVERLRDRLAGAGVPVFALAQSRPSLDDVYLQATGRTLMDAELAVAGQRDVKQERRKSM